MQNITLEKATVNIEALDAALRAALAENILGVSSGRGSVVVHLADSATSAHVAQAQTLVQQHDPATLTPEQQARITRQQRRQALDADVRALDLGAALTATDLNKAVRWLVLRALDGS